MDHAYAVKFQACEKYLLGELSPDLRDAYEDHYFSCPECASQLRSATELIAASKQILAETLPGAELAPAAATNGGWLRWFRPAIAIPVFATLLLVAGYQNLVTIPHLKQATASRVLPMFSLISSNTRGDELPVFSVAPDQQFGLYVDVPEGPGYSSYSISVEGPSGMSSSLRSLSTEDARKTQVVTINPGRRAGKYVLVISGIPSGANPASAVTLAKMQFTVELQP